ncbi:HAD-like domain-containing protein [Poronia punctata]|nr:HAD-like domain-containing protein [Poronia punctata]
MSATSYGYDDDWRLTPRPKRVDYLRKDLASRHVITHSPITFDPVKKEPTGFVLGKVTREPTGIARPPSKESGRAPKPTPEYYNIASQPPCRLPEPRKILVVLDLNGTLVDRPNYAKPASIVVRRWTKRFLAYCLNTFSVVIWSSAMERNVYGMSYRIIPESERGKVVALWGREKFGLSDSDFRKKVLCYKRLEMLWNDPEIAAAHPQAAEGKTWSQLDTVLVDDSPLKAQSHPYNLIRIPEFIWDKEDPGEVLPQVHNYLNECSRQANISAFIKNSPFKMDPKFVI